MEECSMNKLILLKSFAAAAAAALLTSACVSPEPASQDESVFVIADDSTLTQFIVDNKPMDTEIQPGKICRSAGFSLILRLFKGIMPLCIIIF